MKFTEDDFSEMYDKIFVRLFIYFGGAFVFVFSAFLVAYMFVTVDKCKRELNDSKESCMAHHLDFRVINDDAVCDAKVYCVPFSK